MSLNEINLPNNYELYLKGMTTGYLYTTEIDTPNVGENLNIGVNNAGSVTIGAVGTTVVINGVTYVNPTTINQDVAYLRSADVIASPVNVASLDSIKFSSATVSGSVTYNAGLGELTLPNVGYYSVRWQYHTSIFGSTTTLYMNDVSLGPEFTVGNDYNGVNTWEVSASQEVLIATPFINSVLKIVNISVSVLPLAPPDYSKPSIFASLIVKRIL